MLFQMNQGAYSEIHVHHIFRNMHMYMHMYVHVILNVGLNFWLLIKGTCAQSNFAALPNRVLNWIS